jgi:hypothetical protein
VIARFPTIRDVEQLCQSVRYNVDHALQNAQEKAESHSNSNYRERSERDMSEHCVNLMKETFPNVIDKEIVKVCKDAANDVVNAMQMGRCFGGVIARFPSIIDVEQLCQSVSYNVDHALQKAQEMADAAETVIV